MAARGNAAESIALRNRDGQFLLQGDAVLPIYSLTKPFIAAAVLATGIDVSKPISTWLDSDLVPQGNNITVAHLLQHRSGIRDYATLPEYAAAIGNRESPWTDETFAAHTLRQPLLFAPGTGWAYSNPGFWLLSRIARQVTGMSFAELLDCYVSKPLGLEHTRIAHGRFTEDLPGYPAEWVWHGLLLSSAADVARFMASNQARSLMRDLVPVPVEHPLWHNPHNGYGLMVEPGVRYGHNGEGPHYSASCFHFITSGITACVLTRSDTEGAAMERVLELAEAHNPGTA